MACSVSCVRCASGSPLRALHRASPRASHSHWSGIGGSSHLLMLVALFVASSRPFPPCWPRRCSSLEVLALLSLSDSRLLVVVRQARSLGLPSFWRLDDLLSQWTPLGDRLAQSLSGRERLGDRFGKRLQRCRLIRPVVSVVPFAEPRCAVRGARLVCRSSASLVKEPDTRILPDGEGRVNPCKSPRFLHGKRGATGPQVQSLCSRRIVNE